MHALVLHVYYQGVNLVLTNFFSILTQDVGVRKERERDERIHGDAFARGARFSSGMWTAQLPVAKAVFG